MWIDGTVRDALQAVAMLGVPVQMPPESHDQRFAARTSGTVEDLLQRLTAYGGPNARVIQREGYVWVGPPGEKEKAVLVLESPSGEAASWQQLYRLAWPGAELSAHEDVLVVRTDGDTVEDVEALHSRLSTSRRSWLLRVIFAEMSDLAAESIGFDPSWSGQAVLRIGTEEQDASIDLVAKILTEGRKTHDKQIDWASGTMLLTEGQRSELAQGDEVNVALQSVSPEGAAFTSDIRSYQTGVTLRVDAASVATGRVRLKLEPEISTVRGYVDGIPTIARKRFQTVAYVAPGSVTLLAALRQLRGVENSSLMPGTDRVTGRRVTDSTTNLYIFLELQPVE